ncbi:TIGR04197 family type VII secretion effector [Streptococcus panodentis]|uniref:TIGR04197 family type VII secretion effector n=1 Tax=Streptococcus panodentis TaxID=1581472 RepID=A0ABS5AZZ9_9STRE|nr:TIGR04197 family type VII secretion effector [Streptococcus panodentis]MBP2622163.1 hypothetical protein [Streptococcus panodentis]
MAVGTTGIQSDAGAVQSYANGIASGYNAVGKSQATKDSVSEYAASGTISSHIDNEFSASEQAAEQAIDFIQVLHGIHAEFQTTDVKIANYINRNRATAEIGTAGSHSGKQKNARLFSEGTD